MQNPLKSQLMNMHDWADITTALVRQFIYETLEPHTTPSDKDTVSQTWTMKQSIQWVQAQLDDEFNRQMAWASATTAADDVLMDFLSELFSTELGPEITTKKNQKKLLNNLIELTDPAVIVIGEAVADLVQPNPWMVWSIRYRYDIALIEPDDDYRIKIFNQKVEAGDWKLK
jgi:hypothetical protein